MSRGRALSVLEPAVDAAGNRFRSVGKERWSARVDVTRTGGGPASYQVLMEWPGKLLIEGPGAAAVFAPGAAMRGNAASIQGASLRVVGTGYPDPSRPGHGATIVAVLMPSRVDAARGMAAKHYWFDTNTRLLARVVHPKAGRETRLSDWRDIDGDRFPATITVLQDNTVKYTLTLTLTGVGPRLADGTFDPR
jgi:hypothetical protein